ncbi:hypothetical protein JAAARDRAFT_63724 [Jaapia argillacea MUCL 33604]|uniref:Uncharacterized protein n=1 Tax=Jaapia argillacea MUCL 33604 TaxID=933084 RepID=A0A067PEP7_9AGAM|nr:hypothetical protein JAAARDRAFT_63724 [Jaapia argillacea MUCL 33604]
MAQKAFLCSHDTTLHPILSIASADRAFLTRVKSLRREVSPFDEKLRNEKRLGNVIAQV